MVYEWARVWMTPPGEKNPTAVGKLAAGAIAGATAQSITYPLYASNPLTSRYSPELTKSSDVLRRRFQINTMSGMGYQYKSIWDAIKTIVAHEGIKGLYKGISPNLLKVAPSMASSWLSFEFTRDLIVGMAKKDD